MQGKCTERGLLGGFEVSAVLVVYPVACPDTFRQCKTQPSSTTRDEHGVRLTGTIKAQQGAPVCKHTYFDTYPTAPTSEGRFGST